jgi:hypothetical protein
MHCSYNVEQNEYDIFSQKKNTIYDEIIWLEQLHSLFPSHNRKLILFSNVVEDIIFSNNVDDFVFKRSCKFFLFLAIRAQSVSFSRQLMTDREEAPTEEHWSDFQTSGELEERTCLRPDRTRLTPSMKLPMKFGRRSGTHFFEGSTSSWCRP